MKSEYQYMMDKFCGQAGGLKPKNLQWELEDGYENKTRATIWWFKRRNENS